MITVEVNKQSEEKKDIFFQGNIIESENTIVMVCGCDRDCDFNAVVLESKNGMYKVGIYTKSLNKTKFRQFTGTITITSK